MANEVEARQLVIAIVEFLKGEFDDRNGLTPEERDSLAIAIECLELAYGLESHNSSHRRVRRPLLDMFNQVVNPPTVKDRLQADRLKEEGNEKMTEHLYEEALAAYTEAIKMDKWNAVYYCNRAGANLALQHYHYALVDCKQAISLNPDYAKAFGRMGQAYAMMNRPRQAARCFQQAVNLEPDNERYMQNLRTAESQANQADAIAPPSSNLMESILSSLSGARNASTGGGTMSPPSSMMESILNSLSGARNAPTGGGTLTIITEITPTNSDSPSSDMPSEVVHPTDDSQETQPGYFQSPGILQFALPMMLSLLGHHLNHNEDNIGRDRGEETEASHFCHPSSIESVETSDFSSPNAHETNKTTKISRPDDRSQNASEADSDKYKQKSETEKIYCRQSSSEKNFDAKNLEGSPETTDSAVSHKNNFMLHSDDSGPANSELNKHS